MPHIWQVCQDLERRLLPYFWLYSVIFKPCMRFTWKLILFFELNFRLGWHSLHSKIHSLVLQNLRCRFQFLTLNQNAPVDVWLNIGHLSGLLLLLLCRGVLVVHHQPPVLLHCHPVVHLHVEMGRQKCGRFWVWDLVDVLVNAAPLPQHVAATNLQQGSFSFFYGCYITSSTLTWQVCFSSYTIARPCRVV